MYNDKKARYTQRLVNTFPEWSKVRSDHQSFGFQLFNPAGLMFDDIVKQLKDATSGFHLATTRTNEAGLFYTYKLPKSYSFSKSDSDDTELNYITPTVSGLKDDVWYSVNEVEDNSLDNFWRDASPSRLSAGTSYSNYPYLVASGHPESSPFQVLCTSGILDIPNRLTLVTTSGNKYVGFSDNIVRRGTILIEGETRAGVRQTEEQVFIYDDLQNTTDDYAMVSSFNVYDIYPRDTAHIDIYSLAFRLDRYRSAYDLDYSERGPNVPSYWAVGSGITPGHTTLDLEIPQQPDFLLRVGGFSGTYPLVQFELFDELGSNVNATDLTVEEGTDHIWIVDHHNLYLYDQELHYPNSRGNIGKDSDPRAIIALDYDAYLIGDTATIECIWHRPDKGIHRHRMKIRFPNGTEYAVIDGSLVSISSSLDYWNYGEPVSRAMRQPVDVVLSQAGEYVITLETQLADYTVETDKRTVYTLSKTPKAQYNLTSLGVNNSIIGIDIDSEGNIRLLDHMGTVHTVNRHYDTMLIDYKDKQLYFREQYDQVIVR